MIVAIDQWTDVADVSTEREQLEFRLSLLRLIGKPSKQLESLAEIMDAAA